MGGLPSRLGIAAATEHVASIGTKSVLTALSSSARAIPVMGARTVAANNPAIPTTAIAVASGRSVGAQV